MSRNRRKSFAVVGALGALFGGAAVVAGVLNLVLDVRDGRGLEYYLTAEGVQMNPIGALVAIGVVVLLLTASAANFVIGKLRGSWKAQ